MPSRPTGSTTTSCPRPASQPTVSSTAACSIAVTTMRGRAVPAISAMPLIAQLSASVAPLVNSSRPPGPNGAAITSRDTSTAAFASRPRRCGECGLPNASSSSGSIAARASGASGVVA